MTLTTKICSVIFALLEGLAVYQTWFDRDNELFDGMAPGSYKAYVEGTDSVKRLIDFFSLWVGGNKAIMTCLILVAAWSRDDTTRLLSCLSMVAGTSVYFWQQAGVYDDMDEKGELVTKGASETVKQLIGTIILPLWILATASEAKAALMMKNYGAKMKTQ